jgi:hypothetical protein
MLFRRAARLLSRRSPHPAAPQVISQVQHEAIVRSLPVAYIGPCLACAALSIFLDMACTMGTKPACSDSRQSAAYQNVGKQVGVWSWTISVKGSRLVGPLRGGSRAMLNSARVRHLACCYCPNNCPTLESATAIITPCSSQCPADAQSTWLLSFYFLDLWHLRPLAEQPLFSAAAVLA